MDISDYCWEQVLRALKLSSSFKRRASGVLVGKCVIHSEKSPSLHLWPRSRRYKCHGCGAEGDMVSFVIEYWHPWPKRATFAPGWYAEVEEFFKNLPPLVSPDQLSFDFS